MFKKVLYSILEESTEIIQSIKSKEYEDSRLIHFIILKNNKEF